MSTITTKDGTTIYYKDWGTGPVVTFSHGWPLSADAWDGQMLFLQQKGFRVVAHDRRGHGRSSQPSTGNDMNGYMDDPCSCDRGSGPQRRHPPRPFHRRWRGGMLRRLTCSKGLKGARSNLGSYPRQIAVFLAVCQGWLRSEM